MDGGKDLAAMWHSINMYHLAVSCSGLELLEHTTWQPFRDHCSMLMLSWQQPWFLRLEHLYLALRRKLLRWAGLRPMVTSLRHSKSGCAARGPAVCLRGTGNSLLTRHHLAGDPRVWSWDFYSLSWLRKHATQDHPQPLKPSSFSFMCLLQKTGLQVLLCECMASGVLTGKTTRKPL